MATRSSSFFQPRARNEPSTGDPFVDFVLDVQPSAPPQPAQVSPQAPLPQPAPEPQLVGDPFVDFVLDVEPTQPVAAPPSGPPSILGEFGAGLGAGVRQQGTLAQALAGLWFSQLHRTLRARCSRQHRRAIELNHPRRSLSSS